MIRTYAVLGCKVNQYEARQIETLLESAGLQPAGAGPEPPDVCVIHTCAVTQAALAKSAQHARALARGVLHVMMTGCGSAEDLGASIPAGVVRVPAGPDWPARFRAELARIIRPAGAATRPGYALPELTEELLDFWAQSDSMASHLHLPLQSGSDAVLQRMGRGYTAAEFGAAVGRVRRTLDRPAFSTDVIAGFPGETEEDFEQTMAFCEKIGFIRLHVFPFSARPGTRAAQLPRRVPAEIARRRAHRLRALGRRLAHRAHRAAVGRAAEVLCETHDSEAGLWRGYSERYLPMRFPGLAAWSGRLVRVTPTAADADGATTETEPCT